MTHVDSSKSSYLVILLITYVPIMVYGIISPFSGSFLITFLSLHVFLFAYWSLLTTPRNKVLIVSYIMVSGLLASLVFLSSVGTWYLVLIVFGMGLCMAILFLAQLNSRELIRILISQQALFFVLATLSVLHIRHILVARTTFLAVGGPLSFLHAGVVGLFAGYTFVNVKRMGHSEAGKLGLYCMVGGAAILSIGLFDILLKG
jgi:hypothetical protein